MKDVIGKFRVSGVNENVGKLIELCMERKLSVGNMFFFEGKDIHKLTLVTGIKVTYIL